jgi:hypothetical protein
MAVLAWVVAPCVRSTRTVLPCGHFDLAGGAPGCPGYLSRDLGTKFVCIARSWGAPPPMSVPSFLLRALPSRRRGRSRKSRANRDKKVILPRHSNSWQHGTPTPLEAMENQPEPAQVLGWL